MINGLLCRMNSRQFGWLLTAIILSCCNIQLCRGQCATLQLCETCTSPTTCTKCVDSPFNGVDSTGACSACSAKSHCLQCNVLTKCLVCDDTGFGPTSTGDGACGPCALNCATCAVAGAGKCDTCSGGFGIVAADKTCGACLAQCPTCTVKGPGQCDTCITGTGLLTPTSVPQAGCGPCTVPGCAECYALTSKCTKCQSPLVLSPDGSTCTGVTTGSPATTGSTKSPDTTTTTTTTTTTSGSNIVTTAAAGSVSILAVVIPICAFVGVVGFMVLIYCCWTKSMAAPIIRPPIVVARPAPVIQPVVVQRPNLHGQQDELSFNDRLLLPLAE